MSCIPGRVVIFPASPIPTSLHQIFMRYGRQRWKLKGRIEASSRQSWDGEEMVFLPLITDLISIKVKAEQQKHKHVADMRPTHRLVLCEGHLSCHGAAFTGVFRDTNSGPATRPSKNEFGVR